MPLALSFDSLPPIWQIQAVAALVLVAATVVTIVQQNRTHKRLRVRLEEQLAELRQTEKALRVSEVFYHSLVESLPQSILRKDLEGRFTFGNQNFCAELGKTLDEIRNKTDYDFYPRELAEKYRQDDARVIAAGKAFQAVEEHMTPAGEALYVQVTKTPLYDAGGQVIGIQGIFWDVTAQKRAEEQLRAQNDLLQAMAESERVAHETLKKTQSHLVQSEKLAGLGQMVAGVAHEINNPLSFVGNNIAVLQRDLREVLALLALYRQTEDAADAARADLLTEIHTLRDRVDMDYILGNLQGILDRTRDGLGRIQQIVKDLRVFARLDQGLLSDVDLNEGIATTLHIIGAHARKKQVELAEDLGELPPVTCYAAKIHQVIMNLVMNAIDACAEGGKVCVSTRAVNGLIQIEVSDNGSGIDPAIRERIFDPFFTTKPIGVGTGLGLSISYGIVQDHGGSIEVESAPGQGAKFLVTLPLESAGVQRAGA